MGERINGVLFDGDAPPAVNQYDGTLIIVGTAEGVWLEFNEAIQFQKYADVMAVNLALCGFKYVLQEERKPEDRARFRFNFSVQHWTCLHSEFFLIKNLYNAGRVKTHCTHKDREVDFAWPIYGGGTSGLLATKIACAMGYKKIILCGIPIENKRHTYDYPTIVPQNFEDRAVKIAWDEAIQNSFAGRVRSMSGWTQRRLGKPTEEWAHGIGSSNLQPCA